MAQRVYNFSPGPAMMPQDVLEASARALVDFQGKGVGIAEVSHRGKEFDAVREEAEQRCRSLFAIPAAYEVLFLQGGATQQFDLIPMNFLKGYAEYVDSGQWAAKAASTAKAYGDARVIATSKADNYSHLPAGWAATAAADYLHICTNNTIFGTRCPTFPEHHTLIADMSSEIASRPIPVGRFGLIYAGAQKNLGPSGVVLVIVRKELLAKAKKVSPIFSYAEHASAQSCLNTPPTFGIYVLLETFRWLEKQGGLSGMEKLNTTKAELLYGAIDGSGGFYKGTVTSTAERSHMNVTYVLPNEDLTTAFLKEADAAGLVALKGYRSVGGIRASIYNAMPLAGVQKLVALMQDFARRKG